MAYPYRLVGGAAARPDSLNFDPAFNKALLDMYAAAPPEVQRELAISSGYRSKEVQQKLWDASDKTGHSVAAPGKSKHQFGTAADLAGFGLGGDSSVSPETKAWVRNNAGTYNLFFPLGHEPWHIQYSSDSTGAGPTAPTATPLSTVLADATGPTVEQSDKQRLYSGLAAGLSAGRDTRDQAPEVLGDLTGAPQMIGLEAPRATPAPTAAPRLMPAAPNLAELFQVAPIGGAGIAPPTRPVRRA